MKKFTNNQHDHQKGKGGGTSLPSVKKPRINPMQANLATPALRLAHQIREILNMTIPNSGHPLLPSFTVGNVEHHGMGPNFIVQIYSENRGFDYDPAEIKGVLDAMKLKLRFEVAKIAGRRNTPDFEFDVLPPGLQSR